MDQKRLHEVMSATPEQIANSEAVTGNGIGDLRCLKHHPLPWRVGESNEAFAALVDANGVTFAYLRCVNIVGYMDVSNALEMMTAALELARSDLEY